MSAEVYTIACPRCGSAAGVPCWERYCKNGYQNCDYKVCSRVRDLPEPHVARVARAAASDRGAADNFWLVLGSGALALGALTFLFPVLVWPLVVFAAVWMVVAVVSIPFALWLGRRIGGAR